MPRQVEITAASRLHFGMFSFGQLGVRQFGGVGVMIDRPGIQLRITRAAKFHVAGPLAKRVPAVVHRFCQTTQGGAPLPCHIEIIQAAPEHAGLGTGTQLELAVTAGLHAFVGGAPLPAEQLAALSGRGQRSAIGTHGFLRGGLLIESGKLPGETLSPLEAQVLLPADWRFVLVLRQCHSGLAGEAEQQAFHTLPPVSQATTQQLRSLATDTLLAAAQSADYPAFAESLYRFGHLAGMCFAPIQGGPFANPRIAQLADHIRRLGIPGVGQSSWGPTLFAVLPDPLAAQRLVEQLTEVLAADESLLVATPTRQGALVHVQ